MQENTDDQLQSLLASLEIPSEYKSLDSNSPDVITRLDSWKLASLRVLQDLKELLKIRQLTTAEKATVIARTACYDGQGSWIAPEVHSVVTEILDDFSKPSLLVMNQLLETDVNPLFRSNPHPSLNLSTGRKLDRPAGGPMGSIDFYESQAWKAYPGAANLVFWCLRHIQTNDYGRLWHLVIPLVMTFLDDYQVPYKLKGVEMVKVLLEHVPREILKRTGVDGLILNSLNTCLAQLDDAESPRLIQAAISASLSLTLLTTSPGTIAQFDQLCGLLGERIIGMIWLYSYDKVGVVQASVESLPPLLSALGLGCSRYLKALIPQLVHPLTPVPFKSTPIRLQLCSLRALDVVIGECSYRMSLWKGTILEAIGRCWVDMVESPSSAEDGSTRDELRKHLRSSCEALAKACPTVAEEEFRRLLSADQEMFQGPSGGNRRGISDKRWSGFANPERKPRKEDFGRIHMFWDGRVPLPEDCSRVEEVDSSVPRTTWNPKTADMLAEPLRRRGSGSRAYRDLALNFNPDTDSS
ncbi:hypothetical protein D9757_011557 [Collybiopsis confluens]|uniref:Uncharacterized protein n=1 Tax=Collybiopsis confluens TaxID=2823264 RepID=A0A8H5GAZ9_9AGAR|nr:hypothetical protein D9757_011557 [Collybiopsis confluens]